MDQDPPMGEIKLVVVEKLKQIKNENEVKGVSARKIFVYKERKLKKKTIKGEKRRSFAWLKSGSALSEDWGKL